MTASLRYNTSLAYMIFTDQFFLFSMHEEAVAYCYAGAGAMLRE